MMKFEAVEAPDLQQGSTMIFKGTALIYAGPLNGAPDDIDDCIVHLSPADYDSLVGWEEKVPAGERVQ